jgi:hypothetical protein
MNEQENQDLIEAITALRMAGSNHYADLLERMGEYWKLECECSIHDGSNPDCKAHKAYCPGCGGAPSYHA